MPMNFARCCATLSSFFLGFAPCLAMSDVRLQIQSACAADPELSSALTSQEFAPLGLVYSERLVRPEMKAIGVPEGTAKDRLTALLSPYGMGLIETTAGDHLIAQSVATAITAGQVVDEGGAPLANTVINFRNLPHSIKTSASGCFVVPEQLAANEQISIEGFLPYSLRSPRPWIHIQIERQKQRHIEEISVIGSRFRMVQPGSQTSLDREDVAHTPHLGDDITRMFSRLPGTAAGDYSPKVSVRGGMPNEHAIYLDGLELHQPWYFKGLDGLVSVVDSNIIESVDFLSGGFTADYGGRTSGLTHITTLHPADTPTTLGASFMTAFAQTGSTRNNQRDGWLTSLRAGYLDLAFQLAGVDADVRPRYYDGFAKLQTEMGDYNTITLNVLAALDDFDLEDRNDLRLEERVQDSSTNANIWLALNTDLGSVQASNIVSLTDYAHQLTGYDAAPLVYWLDDRSYRAWGIRSDWTLSPWSEHLFKLGADLKYLEADYDYGLSVLVLPFHHNPDGFENTQRRYAFGVTGEDRSAYAAYRVRLTDKLTTEAGARWTQQTYTEAEDSHTGARLNAVYDFSFTTQLNMSWGEFYQAQAIDELHIGDDQTEFFSAQVTEHSVIGIRHQLNTSFAARIDIYHKDYSSVFPRYENLYENVGVFIKEAVREQIFLAPDRSVAEGIEIGLTYDNHQHFSGWANYSYSKVDDHFGTNLRPRAKDQRHNANISLNWNYDHWNFNVSGLWRSGWPYTPIRHSATDGEPYIDPTDYNTQRLNHYLRFDVRIMRKKTLSNGDHFQYYLEVYNILNSENECCTYFDSDDDGNRIPQSDSWMPLLPSFGVRYTFH